jgi:hypothetical protein
MMVRWFILPKSAALRDDLRQVDVLKLGHSRVIVQQGKRLG